MDDPPHDEVDVDSQKPTDLSSASIRTQLVWSSLFPLILFGLLTALVISVSLYQVVLKLVVQRNTAQIQLIASDLSSFKQSDLSPTVLSRLNKSIGSQYQYQLFIVNSLGNILMSSNADITGIPIQQSVLLQLITADKPSTKLIESNGTQGDMIVSIAPLAGDHLSVISTESWTNIMSTVNNYQLVIVILIFLGIFLSLVMLSLSIGRLIKPIKLLAQQAEEAVPGSIFRPIQVYGPFEVRTLINSFNQMVIRLAEQQTSLRQFAQKAMLSQEEERQRLSHELHDGTLQDLVGLSQRVELYRHEMENNPGGGQRRLDELQILIQRTLENVRRISIALRPPVLEDFGLAIALEGLCNDLVQEKPDILSDFKVSGKARRLDSDLELAIYRVVQEALTNIRKHVHHVKLIQVEIEFREHSVLTSVSNDGGGFASQDSQSYIRSGHLGLAGMYERARLFGGTLDITSDPEKYTKILLEMPC